MAEPEPVEAEMAFESVGTRLRNARISAGLGLGDIVARTKIPERHLVAIEESRFSDLASRAYALGFARAFARVVDLDETEVVAAVSEELAADEDALEFSRPDDFEPGDPARVPPAKVVWIAAVGAVLLIVFVFGFGRGLFVQDGPLPDLASDKPDQSPPVVAASSPIRANAGPVVFTALEPDIWARFYDADGKVLMEGQMDKGQSFRIPADANGPLVRTGRPDALQITVGGSQVPPLAAAPVLVKDMPVTADALLARDSAPPERKIIVPLINKVADPSVERVPAAPQVAVPAAAAPSPAVLPE